MYDRNGNPTDDADAMVGGCDTFDGYNDSDPMYDDDDFNPHAPQFDNCPSGWGFCRFENDAVIYLCRSVATSALLGLCREIDYRTACEWLGFDFRVERASDRVWEKCCNECETHAEAVERYTRWANKVAKAI